MSEIAVSTSSSGRKSVTWMVALPISLAAVAALWGGSRWMGHSGAAATTGKFYNVVPVSLDIKVQKDGELQSTNNIEVANKVEGVSTIVQLVKEGVTVKKGDLLVELDSSLIREKILTATLDKQNAETALASSEEMLAIQKSQNEADLEAARVDLQLAKLTLQEYSEGKFPQAVADGQTALRMAEITQKNKQEDLEKTKGLYAKGFVTGTDVKKAQLDLTTSKNDLEKAQRALRVLSDYTHQMEEAKYQSNVVQADKALSRIRRRGASLLAQAEAEVLTKKQTLANKTEALAKLQEQLGYCKIYAPTDGMVVYGGTENRWGDSGQIAEQAQVRERQKLIRLPDLSQMKAVLRVNETQVGRLQMGQKAQVKIIGLPEPVEATVTKISQVVDSGSRWWNPDLKEYPVELALEHTPTNLKPGMSCQAEIYTDRMNDVLAVPLAAIYSDRKGSYVFTQGEDGVRSASIKLGKANETYVQVADGLSEGKNVLLLQPGQGRDLLQKERGESDDAVASAKDDGEHSPLGGPDRPRDEKQKREHPPKAPRDAAAGAPAKGDGVKLAKAAL